MSRLIDADALLNELDKLDLDYGAMGGVAECMDIIDNAPTIEPSGDLISREELLKKLDRQIEWEEANAIPYEDADGGCILGLKKARKYVKLASSTEKPIANDCDLISRHDAIEIIASHDETNGTEKVFTGREITDLLASLPSAERQTDESCRDCPLYDADNHNCPRFNKVIPQTRAELLADRPKVAYICDGRKCDNDCSECFRTLDIEHARDFKLLGGTYYQQESADRFISVVRCKDCKNRVYDDSRDYYYCSMFYGQGDVSDENFCQWGERKKL